MTTKRPRPQQTLYFYCEMDFIFNFVLIGPFMKLCLDLCALCDLSSSTSCKEKTAMEVWPRSSAGLWSRLINEA